MFFLLETGTLFSMEHFVFLTLCLSFLLGLAFFSLAVFVLLDFIIIIIINVNIIIIYTFSSNHRT